MKLFKIHLAGAFHEHAIVECKYMLIHIHEYSRYGSPKYAIMHLPKYGPDSDPSPAFSQYKFGKNKIYYSIGDGFFKRFVGRDRTFVSTSDFATKCKKYSDKYGHVDTFSFNVARIISDNIETIYGKKCNLSSRYGVHPDSHISKYFFIISDIRIPIIRKHYADVRVITA
jgi:hypothetical protein